MKVLQVNSVCGYGSTGRIAADLCRLLKKQGDSGLVAYGRGTAPPDISALRIGSDAGVYLHGAISRLSDGQGFHSKRATERFLKTAEIFAPDVVHLHNLHGYYLHLPTLFSWLKTSGVPVVWTLHDCWAFTGHCAYFDYANCSRWKTGCQSCPQKREYPASLLLDQSQRNYKIKRELFGALKRCVLVSPSAWLAGLAKESFLGDYPVCVIPNGVDLSVFYPREQNFKRQYGLNGKKIALGVANVWEPRKGLPVLLELADKLDDSWQVVVVGLTEGQLRTLPSCVLGLNRTNNVEELAQIYSAADVFLNPTLEENFCLVNLEALACGTPVITFPTGGSPESVDETCGMVTKDKSAAELLRALLSFPMRGWTRESCVARAHRFDHRKQAGQYLALYRQIAEEAGEREWKTI